MTLVREFLGLFQRAGSGLLLAITHAVDLDDSRGQLLLTGSANYLAERSVSETLAGRAGRLVLWPLSVRERVGARETFVDHLFQPESWPPPPGDHLDRGDRHGAEIDLVVSDRRSGRFAGIEIKLTATPTERHARTLARFRDSFGDRFTFGLVVHTGRHPRPLGDRIWAVPVSTLRRSDPAG